MWFTETAWPPIICFAVVASCFLAMAFSTQRAALAWPIPLLIIASFATYFIEQRIVTEGERVEQAVIDVADAFQRQDVDGTLSFFSPTFFSPMMPPHLVASAVMAIQAQDDLTISDLDVTTTNNDTRASSHFRANGSFTWMGNDVGHQPTRWQVGWQKEAGEWRIISVERLDPLRGDPMPWDAQQATLN